MRWITKQRVKYALAGIGVVYLLLFVAYVVYAGVTRKAPAGASELEAHPERQDEILAQRRAQEMKEQLKLTDEQARDIAAIMAKQPEDPDEEGGRHDRRRALHGEIAKVLTPDQLAQMEQMRDQSRGPGRGGPMSRLTPERLDSIRKGMTPEQQAKLDKKIQEWKQRRQQGRDGGRRDRPQPPQR